MTNEGRRLSTARLTDLSRSLNLFSEVVGPMSVDEGTILRWLSSRDGLAPSTLYDEFCSVRAFCSWLAQRRFITSVDWSRGAWPKRRPRPVGHRDARESRIATGPARAAEVDFEEFLCNLGLSRRTIDEYVREVLRAKTWMSEHGYDLETARPSAVAAYADSRSASWSTRKMARSALAHYWTMTERAKPPVNAIRVPPKPRGRCRALEEAASAKLALAARARGDDPGLAVALMLYAGLRRAEVASLRWECFDGAMEWLTIQGKLDVEGTVAVHPRLRSLLIAKGRSTGYVFPGRFPDQPSTSHRIYHWVLKVAEEAGVSEVSPHRLRHVAISTVNDNTGNLRAAQDFARHADPSSTSIYTRTTKKRMVAAVASIDY